LRTAIAAAIVAAWLGVVTPVDAFQKETTNDPDCTEAPGVNCPHRGAPLFWNVFPVRFFINSDASGLGFSTVSDAVARAFSTWQSAGNDGIVFELGGQSHRGSDGQDGCNTVSWKRLGNNAADTFAQSVLTYDRNAGEIFDVDIEMNGDFQFAVLPAGESDPFDPRPDIQGVSTHEAGHLLGLAHENRFGPAVVMFFSDTSGDTTHRSLTADDQSGVVSIYPSRAVSGVGTNTDCLGASGGGGGGGHGGGCALSPSRSATELWPVGFVLAWLARRKKGTL
jgi:hypothetical protein